MKITAGTLILALAMVLNSIGLSSQASGARGQQPNQVQLGPAIRDDKFITEHVVCYTKVVRYSPNDSPILQTLHGLDERNERVNFDRNTFLVKRGPDVFIGWDRNGKTAQLFDEYDEVVAVDRFRKRKIQMSDILQEIIGVGLPLPAPKFKSPTRRNINPDRRDSSSSESISPQKSEDTTDSDSDPDNSIFLSDTSRPAGTSRSSARPKRPDPIRSITRRLRRLP